MPRINDITLAILSFYPNDKIEYGLKKFYTALETCQKKYAILEKFLFDYKWGYPFCEEVDNAITVSQQALVLQRKDISSPYLDINIRTPRQEFIDKGKLTEDELKQLEEIATEMFKVMTANPN